MFKLFKRKAAGPPEVQKPKVRVSGWWKLPLYILLFIGGLALMYMGNENNDPVTIAIGFLPTLAGIILFVKSGGMTKTRVLPGGKKLKVPANALVIYPDAIEFDYIKKPPGHQQRCINDGKWYSVLIGKRGEKLGEFLLPDDNEESHHYDPHEFANPVTMPANQKLFEPLPNKMKTIAVGMMALGIGILAFTIIALSG